MSRPRLAKLRRRTAGVIFLLVMAALITLSVQIYQKKFVSTVEVTLDTDRIGNQLHPTSDVKARGVVVGEVRQVHSDGHGARIELALQPDKVARLPKNVSALLVPKTLFGERYVQLSIPDGPAAPPLAAGDVIAQDRSANAIELERVFDNLLPVLQAVQPEKLATTLTAVSTALRARGEKLGETLVAASNYLDKFNPHLPQLNGDVRELAKVSALYGDIAPDLLDSLTSAAVTLNTVAGKRTELDSFYDRLTSSADDLTVFLQNNQNNLIRLESVARGPLELFARYAPALPCTLGAMTALKPAIDSVLGAGTGKPGMHIEVRVTADRGPYRPGVDDPVYTATGGPRCYPSGVAPTGGIPMSAIEGAADPVPSGERDGLGVANSPQEQQLLASLVAPAIGSPPDQVPGWSSILVGALYRGAEVKIQ